MCLDQLFLLLFDPILFILWDDNFFKLRYTCLVQADADLLGCPSNQTRWQVNLNFHVRVDFNTLSFVINNWLCNLLSICLVTSVVLNFDMKIETALTGIRLWALRVWTLELTFNLVCTASIVLLPATHVSFTGRSFEIFWVIVELLNLYNAFQKRVPINRFTEDFLHQIFIFQVHLPVHFEVIRAWVVLWQLKAGINWDSTDFWLGWRHFNALVIDWCSEVSVIYLACRWNHLKRLNDIISLQNVEILCLQRFIRVTVTLSIL